MTGPFDTVDDAKDWLAEEGPTESEVREAIETEEEGESRKTALSAFRDYLDSFEGSSDSSNEGTEFVFTTYHGDYEPGESVTLDPDSEEATRLRRGGIIRVE